MEPITLTKGTVCPLSPALAENRLLVCCDAGSITVRINGVETQLIRGQEKIFDIPRSRGVPHTIVAGINGATIRIATTGPIQSA